jgi:glutaredoxin
MFVIRWLLGRIILLLNFIFSPKAINRSSEQQLALDTSTEHLSLYQLPACPFCVKVRRDMKRNGLNINLRNINNQSEYKDELIREGGKRTVPCLKITSKDNETKWLYESKEIINYLHTFVH